MVSLFSRNVWALTEIIQGKYPVWGGCSSGQGSTQPGPFPQAPAEGQGDV